MENKKEDDLLIEANKKIEVMEFSNNIMIISMVFVICEFVLWVSNVIDIMTYLIFCVVSYSFYFYHKMKYKRADRRVLEILDQLNSNN